MSGLPVLHQQNRTPQFNAAHPVNSVFEFINLDNHINLIKIVVQDGKRLPFGHFFFALIVFS